MQISYMPYPGCPEIWTGVLKISNQFYGVVLAPRDQTAPLNKFMDANLSIVLKSTHGERAFPNDRRFYF